LRPRVHDYTLEKKKNVCPAPSPSCHVSRFSSKLSNIAKTYRSAYLFRSYRTKVLGKRWLILFWMIQKSHAALTVTDPHRFIFFYFN
jgi:hypothetical protein